MAERRPAGRIAVVGASNDRRKFGNKCVRAYQRLGWRVFPVNPVEAEVEGETAYPRILDVPEELELIALYLPPARTLGVLPQIAEKGARDGVFFNPGTYDEEVLRRAAALAVPVRRECAIVAAGLSPSQFPG